LVLAAGWVLILIGLLFLLTSFAAPRALCLVAGLLVTGAAVSWRLRTSGQDFTDRGVSAGFLVLAFVVVAMAYVGAQGWDRSGARGWPVAQLFLGVLAAVTLAGAVLVLLPSLGRRIVVSLMILYHFGGILTATTSVPPPGGGDPPWLSMQLWNNFGYAHYLRFIYEMNAYHFYSPDPGPPHHLWFYVRYKDGSDTWVRLPDRVKAPTALNFQRMLALTESINQQERNPLTQAEVQEYNRLNPEKPYTGDPWEVLERRREVGAALHPELGWIMDLPRTSQYFNVNGYGRKLVASYARHVAWTTPHPKDLPVESVKVYFLRHQMLSPAELKAGYDPVKDERLYWAWFMGEFNREGKLLDPKEPFLYWRLPIVKVSQGFPLDGSVISYSRQPEDGKLLNCVEIHAALRKR
jgi:hypothetical protein